MTSPRIMLVAGEASGDLHAADLAREIKLRLPGAECFGLGGDRMQAAGVEIVQDLVSLAVIGVAEALKKLGSYLRALRCARDLLRRRRPQVLVLVDFPDLNLRIAAAARDLGVPVVYYISPQIWAWRPRRIELMKRLVSHMVVILPFEEDLYRRAGIPVTYVGHPLLDVVKPEVPVASAKASLLAGSPGPLVALMPGSRVQELDLLLPLLCRTGQRVRARLPRARFFIPLARTLSRRRVESILAAEKFSAEIVNEHPYASRAAADVTLVASGTATLETAILGVPMLIVYRMHWFSYALARLFVKLPYFGLANLVAGKKVAPEFLQGGATPERLARATLELLGRPELGEVQVRAWAGVRERLGGSGAAGRAAAAVLSHVAR